MCINILVGIFTVSAMADCPQFQGLYKLKTMTTSGSWGDHNIDVPTNENQLLTLTQKNCESLHWAFSGHSELFTFDPNSTFVADGKTLFTLMPTGFLLLPGVYAHYNFSSDALDGTLLLEESDGTLKQMHNGFDRLFLDENGNLRKVEQIGRLNSYDQFEKSTREFFFERQLS